MIGYDCLLTAMAAWHAVDLRDLFLFVGDLSGHRQEWSDSTTTKRHGVERSILPLSGYDRLVLGPTHARGGTHDLLMTDVPDLVRVAVVAPL